MDQRLNILKEDNIPLYARDTSNHDVPRPASIAHQQSASISKSKDIISNIDKDLMETVYLLASTLWLEARGEGEQGMHAVLNVIANRAGNDIKKIKNVILKPKQFSCWNSIGDPIEFSRKMIRDAREGKLKDSKQYYIALNLVDSFLKGNLKDITGNALFYFNPSLAKPSWASKLKKTTSIGRHDFYTIMKEYKNDTFLNKKDAILEYKYPLPKNDKDWESYGGMVDWKGKIIYMTPDEYLSMVTKLPKEYFNIRSYENIKHRIKNNLPLDPPVLEVDFENRSVIAHEGRHRAIAAKDLGLEKIPVFIYTGNLYKRVPEWTDEEHKIIDNLTKYFSPEGSKRSDNKENKLFEYIEYNLERFREPLKRYIKRVFSREYNEKQMLMFDLTMDEFIDKLIDRILNVKININYTKEKDLPVTGVYKIDRNEIEINDVNLDKYETSNQYSAYVDSVIFHELVHAVNYYKKLYDKVSYSELELGKKYYYDPEELRAYTAEIHDFLKKLGYKPSQIKKIMSKYTSDPSKEREEFIDFVLKQKLDEFYKLIV